MSLSTTRWFAYRNHEGRGQVSRIGFMGWFVARRRGGFVSIYILYWYFTRSGYSYHNVDVFLQLCLSMEIIFSSFWLNVHAVWDTFFLTLVLTPRQTKLSPNKSPKNHLNQQGTKQISHQTEKIYHYLSTKPLILTLPYPSVVHSRVSSTPKPKPKPQKPHIQSQRCRIAKYSRSKRQHKQGRRQKEKGKKHQYTHVPVPNKKPRSAGIQKSLPPSPKYDLNPIKKKVD